MLKQWGNLRFFCFYPEYFAVLQTVNTVVEIIIH